MSTRQQLFMALATVLVIGATGTVLLTRSHRHPHPQAHPADSPSVAAPVHRAVIRKHTNQYLGIITKPPLAPEPLKANIGEFYTSFTSSFPARIAGGYRQRGMVPFIQVNPRGIDLANIAAGKFDDALRSYALQARNFRTKLIYSFGHEMNCIKWYSWCIPRTKPAVFVAAFRHIHRIFNQEHASNVLWAWDPNILVPHSYGLKLWWPGAKFVDLVGIDGYIRHPNETFNSMFGRTIREVRSLTTDPIILAEVAVAPGPRRPAKIREIFSGIRRFHLQGMVWFDIPGLQNYRIDSDPASIAAINSGASHSSRL